jgi:hypothetical protein
MNDIQTALMEYILFSHRIKKLCFLITINGFLSDYSQLKLSPVIQILGV